jgi:hypothetical protein
MASQNEIKNKIQDLEERFWDTSWRNGMPLDQVQNELKNIQRQQAVLESELKNYSLPTSQIDIIFFGFILACAWSLIKFLFRL